jgi:hypothetical protein
MSEGRVDMLQRTGKARVKGTIFFCGDSEGVPLRRQQLRKI